MEPYGAADANIHVCVCVIFNFRPKISVIHEAESVKKREKNPSPLVPGFAPIFFGTGKPIRASGKSDKCQSFLISEKCLKMGDSWTYSTGHQRITGQEKHAEKQD